MVVSKKISFDAAHFLPGYKGKCANTHGHHWVVELAVDGKVDKNTGMVVDFVVLKEFLETIENTFDHKLLNDIIENPTAENICLFVADRFADWWKNLKMEEYLSFKLRWIKIWETEDSMAMLEA